MKFYLGTHMPNWLEYTDVPLFISYNRLVNRKSFPRAKGEWILDSGAFTSILQNGRHSRSAKQYANDVRRISNETGNMSYASIQDWMTEDNILRKTGLSIAEHQLRSTYSYIELLDIDNTISWLPVLQGQTIDDYKAHIDMYDNISPAWRTSALVGVGSICRRQATDEISALLETLHTICPPLHAFGMKITGLRKSGSYIASSDSMSWSYDARRAPPLMYHQHINCANCLEYALLWRNKLLAEWSAHDIQIQATIPAIRR